MEITKANFTAEVLNSETPVLVDFWADWCGPCKMLAPTIAELEDEYAGKVKVGKINVDNEPELAAQFGIMSIPTVLLFRDGAVAEKSVGFVPKEALKEMLEK